MSRIQIYKVISPYPAISGRTRRPLFVCLFHDFIVLILFLLSCPIGGLQHGHSGGPIAGRHRPCPAREDHFANLRHHLR